MTNRTERARKPIELTLSETALKALAKLAEDEGASRSAVVERLVRRAAGVSVALLAFFAVGCTIETVHYVPSTQASAVEVNPTKEQACDAIGTSVCKRMDACNAPGFKEKNPTVDACVQREKDACMMYMGVAACTSEQLNACTTGISLEACGDLELGIEPDPCSPCG